MKRTVLILIMLVLLLTGCISRENSERLPEQTLEATDSPERNDSEVRLPVFEKVFLRVSDRTARTSLKDFSALMDQETMEWSMEEGVAVVLEQGCEGSFLYAVVTNEHGFDEIAQLGYHLKTNEGEYEIMADMTGSEIRYLVDVFYMDSGTEVASLEMVKSYIMDAALPSMDTPFNHYHMGA